jgi:hypothetical protein
MGRGRGDLVSLVRRTAPTSRRRIKRTGRTGVGRTLSIIEASFLEGAARRNFLLAIAHDFIKGVPRSKNSEPSRLISIKFAVVSGVSKVSEGLCLCCSGGTLGSYGFTHLRGSCIWRVVIMSAAG